MLIFPKTPFFSSQKSTLPSNLTHNKGQKKTFQTTLVILSTDLIMTWSCISYTSYVTSCQMNWDFENLVIKKLSKLGGQAGSVFSLPFGILSFLNRDQILRKSIYSYFWSCPVSFCLIFLLLPKILLPIAMRQALYTSCYSTDLIEQK